MKTRYGGIRVGVFHKNNRIYHEGYTKNGKTKIVSFLDSELGGWVQVDVCSVAAVGVCHDLPM